MSNWICKECGATYIDVSHQEPSVLKQELELRKLKEVLFKCREKLDQLDYGCEVWQGDLTPFIEEIDEVLK